jgi:AraC-like DNA-binding protein
MEFTAAFGRRKDGKELTFFHKDETVTAAKDDHLLHLHPECELYICLSGRCDFITESGRYHLDSGTLVLTRPGELHSIGINRDCRYNRFYIRIPRDYFDFWTSGLADPFATVDRDVRFAAFTPTAAEEAGQLLYEIEAQLSSAKVNESRCLCAFFRLCALATEALLRRDREVTNLLHPTVLRAVSYIHRNFATLSSVKSVADQVGVSAAYLSRLFRANMNTTVTAYLRFKRMEYARLLLREGLPLVDVCGRCGYDDYSYFIAEFRRQTGTTPIRYQKSFFRKESEAETQK